MASAEQSKSEWLNDPKEAIALAQKLEDEKPYDESKLVQIQQNHMKQIVEKRAQKEVMKQIREKQQQEEEMSEEIPEKILWN